MVVLNDDDDDDDGDDDSSEDGVKSGSRISTVTSCDIAIINESAVLMIAANEPVVAMTAMTFANPPTPISASSMSENGSFDSNGVPSCATRIVTPMVPIKIPLK